MYSYKICIHYIFSVTTNSIVSDINKILNQYNYGDSPSLIQFWIMANFNPQISNILEGLQQQYGISIILNSARDLPYFEVACKIFQEYIIKKLPRVIDDTSIDEYYSRISKSDHYLVDRDYERHLLSSNQFSSYYIIGLSFSGKTQLLKNVIKEYADKNYPIFWHTVISNDSNIQYRTFIISLGHYFIHRHKESKLNAYLDKYGCGISGELFSLITMLLKSYKPIVIIDDIHKCNSENLKFKQIIELFIQESECRLYMAGWFNIFNTNIEIRKNVRFITLNGLSYEYLNQIIKNRIGCSRIQIAQEIEKKYSGLPGYAELVEQTTNIKALGNVNSYFTSFIKSLTYNEQLVLFMLGYVSVPLHITYFENLNLLDALYVLAQKKLIREEGEYYSVHDTYRSFLTNYSVNQNLFSEILTLADTIISKNYRAALDIINICINKRKYIEAYTIISNEFELFIQHQIFYELLQYLQLIESADVSINGLDLLFKKVLLLERINDYQLCISYICLISSDLKAGDEIKYIYCLYVYMRCLYFTNKYDDIIKIYKENSDYIINSSDKKILCQILLLVGRIFYIRGDLDTAGTIYVLAYQLGFGNKVLENKIIYRIGMVEYKKGLIEESAKTFSQLLKSNLYLTPKRKSYIYNKLARSYIELGNIIQAQYNNDESLKIKKIYNDERGIIFCCKIQARILLYQHKLLEAMMVLEKAEELSIKLKLNKELLSIHMMQISIKLKYNNVNADNLLTLLDNCIAICEKEKLLGKLCIISNICNIYYPNLRERIDRIKNDIQKYNQIEANLILNQFENIFSTISKSWVQSIKSNNCISHQMLQLSHFII